MGNHEFHSQSATYYFEYFGAAAGDPKTGYYSYDLGSWHIVVLNSECNQVGGCQAGSPEEKWLRADLAANRPLARWLFSQTALQFRLNHGDDPELTAFWQAFYDNNVELVLNGHDHDYERFAPQDPDGKADPKRGIREFVVGTGGKSHREFGFARPNSEIRNHDAYGVLQLTLKPAGYDWQFLPEAGKTFTDSGSGACH